MALRELGIRTFVAGVEASGESREIVAKRTNVKLKVFRIADDEFHPIKSVVSSEAIHGRLPQRSMAAQKFSGVLSLPGTKNNLMNILFDSDRRFISEINRPMPFGVDNLVKEIVRGE